MVTGAKETLVQSPGEEVGGGLNPSSRDLEGCGVGGNWKDEGMRLDSQSLNHLSPGGLVGFSRVVGEAIDPKMSDNLKVFQMGAGHLSLLSRHGFWCTCRRKGKLQLDLLLKY